MLAACRSLHAAGWTVGAAAGGTPAPTHWSRACSRRLRVVDPSVDADAFVEQLRVELTRHRYAALVPGSDGALLAISERRERLAPLAALGLPAHAVVTRVLRRESLAEAATNTALSPLISIRCANTGEALRAGRELGLPVALKSTHAALARDGVAWGTPKGRIAYTEAQLLTHADDFLAHGDDSLPRGDDFPTHAGDAPGQGDDFPTHADDSPGQSDDFPTHADDFPGQGDGPRGSLLVQPLVPGEPISFGGVRAGGKLLGVAVSRYLRMWPPSGGSVAFGQTIAVPPELEEMVERLLDALAWEGIFEIELIRAGRPGARRWVPIDLNPRPYGSLALATAAGAPLTALWCEWLRGRGARSFPSAPLRARPGVRYRWEDAELRYMAWQLRHGHPRAALAPLRPRRAVMHAHFERSDPLPLLARGIYLGKRMLRRP